MSKMAPITPSSHKADDLVKELLEAGEVFPWQDDGAPLLEYKKLAIEVGRQITPGLQETLNHMMQAPLGKLKQKVYTWNNLQMVGLPEVVKPLELQLLWKQELPRAQELDHTCWVERAHRVGPESLIQGSNTHWEHWRNWRVIMKFFKCNNKSEIFRAYHKRLSALTIQ